MQSSADDPDWTEADTPPPPAFELKRGLPFDVSINSSLQFSVDPQTIQFGKDGVTSYVVMATSSTGALNAMYEGLRCATGEFKTYARYNPGSGWSLAKAPLWKSVFATDISPHTLRLARKALCSGTSPVSNLREVVTRLKSTMIVD